MNKLSSTERLRHGHHVEDQFEQFMSNWHGWQLIERGQRRLPDFEQLAARQIFVPFDTIEGKELLNLLPDIWRPTYYCRLKTEGIPNRARYEPDFTCVHRGSVAFDAEIKSEMKGYENIAYELSGYIWAQHEYLKTGKEKIFIFAIGEQVFDWYYLFLSQIVDKTIRVLGGNDCVGSGRPFGLIPKASLTQPLEELLWYFETFAA